MRGLNGCTRRGGAAVCNPVQAESLYHARHIPPWARTRPCPSPAPNSALWTRAPSKACSRPMNPRTCRRQRPAKSAPDRSRGRRGLLRLLEPLDTEAMLALDEGWVLPDDRTREGLQDRAGTGPPRCSRRLGNCRRSWRAREGGHNCDDRQGSGSPCPPRCGARQRRAGPDARRCAAGCPEWRPAFGTFQTWGATRYGVLPGLGAVAVGSSGMGQVSYPFQGILSGGPAGPSVPVRVSSGMLDRMIARMPARAVISIPVVWPHRSQR